MRSFKLLSILAILMLLAAVPATAQEATDAATAASADMPSTQNGATASDAAVAAPAVTAVPAPAVEAEQSRDVSIYGEVLTVNAAGNTLTVQYYDYDTDEEKTVDLNVTADTKMENAAALNDVKKGDWVDALYTVQDNKNLAKSIMVEKEEVMPSETPTGMEEEPQSLQ